MADMSYSEAGLQLTESFEGLELTAYRDVVGVLTIGYGHTGSDVVPGLTITQEQAEALLDADVQSAVDTVNHVVTVDVTQGQFDAMVDFTFNLGCGAFKGSTLAQMVNAGNFAGAAGQFPLWDHAGGAVVQGLLARRQAEVVVFNS